MHVRAGDLRGWIHEKDRAAGTGHVWRGHVDDSKVSRDSLSNAVGSLGHMGALQDSSLQTSGGVFADVSDAAAATRLSFGLPPPHHSLPQSASAGAPHETAESTSAGAITAADEGRLFAAAFASGQSSASQGPHVLASQTDDLFAMGARNGGSSTVPGTEGPSNALWGAGTMSDEDIRGVLADILRGLVHMHEAGFTHKE